MPFFWLYCFWLLLVAKTNLKRTQLDTYKSNAEKIQEQNKEIVREVINAIDSGDRQKPGNLLSDDFALYSPGSLQPWRKEALFKARNTHFAAFPDWIHKIEIMIADSDKVAVKLTQYGTSYINKYKGIQLTSKYVTVLYTDIYHAKGLPMGKLNNWRALEENPGLMLLLNLGARSYKTGEENMK